MKMGHWVILRSVIVFLGTVYLTMFRNASVNTTPLVSPAQPVTTTAPLKAEFDPQSLQDLKKLDPFKTKKNAIILKEFYCATPVPPSIAFRLVSTSVLADRSKSLAILADPALGAMEVREGQKLNENMEVYQINRMQVLLKNFSNNTCEVISLVSF